MEEGTGARATSSARDLPSFPGNAGARDTAGCNAAVWSAGARLVIVAAMCAGLAACNTTADSPADDQAEISATTKFSAEEYGVAASQRVTTSKSVPKGGGRQMVGKPYKIRGKWYTPELDPTYNETGLASWYGPNFHGRKTANGEIYDQYHLSAAHPTMPLPSYARVTNQTNGHSVVVRVNDRGPFAHGRIIDVSSKAADLLDFKSAGVAKVKVAYVGPADMNGRDMPYLMASYIVPGDNSPVIAPEGEIAPGVMTAMNASSMPGVASDAFALHNGGGNAGQRAARSQAISQDADTAVPGAPAQSLAVATQPVVGGSSAGGVSGYLPAVGPVPPTRPAPALNGAPDPSGIALVKAFAPRQQPSAAMTAIDAVLLQPEVLSAADIKAYWQRRIDARTDRKVR